MKCGTRRALAGLCLAGLSVPPGAALFAAEDVSSPAYAKADAVKVPASGEARADASALDLGGAIYSPFSPASAELAARPAAQGPVALPQRHDAVVGLAATTVTAFIAAGVLFVLVRMLMF